MRKYLLILLIASGVWAQPSPNSVSQLIANKSIAATGTVRITAGNIGQNSHQLYLYTTDAVGGGGCSGFTGVANLSGSIDNVIYKQISTSVYQPLSFLTDSIAYVAFAQGTYPYLRVVWTNSDPADCAITLWYTASISPQAYTGSPRVINDQFSYKPISIAAAGDNTVTTGCPGITTSGAGVLVLYELYLYNPSAANTVLVKLGDSGGNYITYLTLTNMQQFAQFAGMPNTGKAHYVAYQTLPTRQDIVINLANATALTGFAVYRCE